MKRRASLNAYAVYLRLWMAGLFLTGSVATAAANDAVFKSDAEVLAYHHAYLENHPGSSQISALLPPKSTPSVLRDGGNGYEVVYAPGPEKVRFYYRFSPITTHGAETFYLDVSTVVIEQRTLPLWTQATSYLDHDAYLGALERPVYRAERFCDGTRRIRYYEYTYGSDDVKVHETLDFHETESTVTDVLNCSDTLALPDMELPLSSRVRQWMRELKKEKRP